MADNNVVNFIDVDHIASGLSPLNRQAPHPLVMDVDLLECIVAKRWWNGSAFPIDVSRRVIE